MKKKKESKEIIKKNESKGKSYSFGKTHILINSCNSKYELNLNFAKASSAVLV